MRIAIDIMGGDFAPENSIKGALLSLKELSPKITLVLIGKKEIITSSFPNEVLDADSVDVVDATQVIDMGESPIKAISKNPDSSIAIGFKLLQNGDIDGFASAGNTGAMLVGAIQSVGAIPGIYRPCITTAFPKINGSVTIILDVGINADCKPDVLYQFAILGSLYAEYVYNIENPRVGLLNIGAEEKKGNLLAQATHDMMKGTDHFNFIGNVEGSDLLSEDVDVIVCDGFTGNVVLKEAEAFYYAIKKRGIDDEYLNKFNYENYGGTPILGINAPVIIGHGHSNDIAIKNMILLTSEIAEAQLPEKIKAALIK